MQQLLLGSSRAARADYDSAVSAEASREVLDWALFGTASRALATRIAADGYRADLHDLGGADRVEAADRLTTAVLDGKLKAES